VLQRRRAIAAGVALALVERAAWTFCSGSALAAHVLKGAERGLRVLQRGRS
jgi:hypothetical protein